MIAVYSTDARSESRLSIVFWWRPVSRRHTSTGYIRASKKE
ncbi:MAG TPA: hypothetical protein VJ842_12770 [Pyrinomonadaceae bacterium]|nr:hypothetical protein [Pyrinomonadaceae bacterium]